MTRQEIFDAVSVALLKQGRKSLMSCGCAYRSADDCRCAVGVLIPDELYHPCIEARAISYICGNLPHFKDWVKTLEGGVDFLIELQHIHDVYDPRDWAREFRIMAEAYNFSTEQMDAVLPPETTNEQGTEVTPVS